MSTNLTRALAWKQEARMQLAILKGLGRDPSHERDVAYDAWAEADANWRKLIREEWTLRMMERHVPNVTRAAYQNDTPTQAHEAA